MNKQYFVDLANYNIWANDIAINWLNQINDEQWNKEINSSFNSIALTCIHIAGAEKIWLERWESLANPIFLFAEFNGTKNDLISIWQQASTNILQFISKLPETNYSDSFTFKRLNGEINEMQYAQAFTHVINHSTYHRGQLVTMLRQVGFTDVSSTDYLMYCRR